MLTREKTGQVERSPQAEALRAHWPLWIGGRAVEAHSPERLELVNPADGMHLCSADAADASDVGRAVSAAGAAQRGWARLPVAERARLLHGVAAGLLAVVDELARIETLNNGKPLRDAVQDVRKSAAAFEFYAGAADKLFGSTIPASPEYLNYTLREPVGVTAHVAPWNYPLRLAVRSIAPALAAGNAVVLKPAEQTPLSALRLAEVLSEAGIPDGVFNVVPGLGPVAGAALASHAGVRHIAFTGSLPTGIEVMRRAARNVCPVTLELGGKSPNIVFADADMDRAVAGALEAGFANAGQVCCAGSRLLLQDKIYDEFLSRLIDQLRHIHLGPGLDNADMGPLITAEQKQRVLDWIRLGQQDNATLLFGGNAPSDPALGRGFFVEPTLLACESGASRIAREEVFGPVLTVFRFRSDADALRLANDSDYGLVAGIWTASLDRAHAMARELQAGQVYVNDFFSGSVACPFGGTKRSGFGRERGVEALQHYTQVKSVCVRLGRE